MKIKKIPYYLFIFLLTLGASLTLGLLSFSGMFALWPIVPLAGAAFFLATVYEGEIFFQNIKSALNKLLNPNYLRRVLSSHFLLEHFPKDTAEANCPQFFRDYQAQLIRLNDLKKACKENRRSTQLKKLKKQAQKALGVMDKWFSEQAIPNSDHEIKTPYQKAVADWLQENAKGDALQASYQKQWLQYQVIKVFSLLSGVFMGLGTTYLLSEAVLTIPFLSTLAASATFGLPMMVVAGVLTVSAGLAYAMISYNSISNMFHNNIMQKWHDLIKESYAEGFSFKNSIKALGIVLLLFMAALLTICSAGTWWTVVKNSKPLFNWISRLPFVVMAVINPVIIGLSSTAFNLTNSYETYCEIAESAEREQHQKESLWQRIKTFVSKLTENENWMQFFNPCRWLITLFITPIHKILFLGHLVSIGVTTDRVPKVPSSVTAVLGIVAEGFEDYHYFMHTEHHHEHHHFEAQPDADALLKARLENGTEGHSHANDIPLQAIKIILSPLYLGAILWDWGFSKCNNKEQQLSLIDACKKHSLFVFDYYKSKPAASKAENEPLPENLAATSTDWKKEHAIYKIDRHCQKKLSTAWVKQSVSMEKIEELQKFKKHIINATDATLSERLALEKKNNSYNKYRLFTETNETKPFIDQLADTIGVPCA